MRSTLIVTVLLICYETGHGSLIQKPQDSVAIIGKTTYFNCSTSEPSKRILWYHYDVDDVQREAIYLCDNFTEYWYPCYRNGRYVIERNIATGAYNLVIPTVVSSDAGRLQCEVDGDEGFANLTVRVESNPSCEASESCKPYIDAIICIFVIIILPTAIVGTIILLWYQRVYKPKKQKQKEMKVEDSEERATDPSPVISSQVGLKTEENDIEVKEDSNESQQDNKPLMSTSNDTTDNIRQLEKVIDTQAKQIKDLKKKLESKINEAKEFTEQIQQKTDQVHQTTDQVQQKSREIKKLQESNKVSENENSQMRARIKDLEGSLYPSGNIDYPEKPNLLHTVITGATQDFHTPINGIAVLGTELFVLHEKYPKIEVYNIVKYQFDRMWEVQAMSLPMDIASCKIVNCLYVMFRDEKKPESEILKLEPNGTLINKWSTGGDRGRLSTYESNVICIVCVYEKQLIKEYSSDGVVIHTIHLSPTMGLNHPLHAIKVTGSHFALCHGETKDDQHRVCVVDAEGKIVKELKEWKTKESRTSGKFNGPICLAQDCERSILVADRDNQRVWLINSALKHHKCLLKKETELEGFPVRICLDEANGRLFVATNILKANKTELKEGNILIFSTKL